MERSEALTARRLVLGSTTMSDTHPLQFCMVRLC
jgi:hypothetical protein